MRIGNLAGSPAEMSIEVPDGWYYKESVTIVAPDSQSNIILSSEWLDESLTGNEYAEIQADQLERGFPGYRQLSYEEFALPEDGVAGLRVFEWNPESGPPVTQMQLYYVIPGRGITSTATAPTAHFPQVKATLFDVFRSISVTRGVVSAADSV
jgi:hypothetical protein